MALRRFRNPMQAVVFLSGVILLSTSSALAGGPESITTYHYDNYRTGWNQNETLLTPATVSGPSFGLLQTVTVDDQVDAQPLYVPSVNITTGNFQGTHNVVYVVTGNNSVYAIDAESGTVLLSVNFGAPVKAPLGCHNNGPNVGITSPAWRHDGTAITYVSATSSGEAVIANVASVVDKARQAQVSVVWVQHSAEELSNPSL